MTVVREESQEFEGVWDCPSCNITGISVFVTECPECHMPWTPNEDPRQKPYLPANARVITDPEKLEIARGGKNWTCDKCGQVNRKKDTECSNPDCRDKRDRRDTFWRRTVYSDKGPFTKKSSHYDDLVPDPVKEAERLLAGDEDARDLEDERRPLDEVPRTGSSTAELDAIRQEAKQRADDQERFNKLNPAVQLLVMFWRFVMVYWKRLERFQKPIIVGGIATVVIGVIAILVATISYFTATVDGTVTVTERHWERSVEVERYVTLQEDDWTYPNDARIISSRTEIRDYETVTVGYRPETYTEYKSEYAGTEDYVCGSEITDNANGTFKSTTKYCSRPKYTQVAVPKTRQVPVTEQRPIYGTKYTYEIDRWVTSRWVSASDTMSDVVVWPEVTDLQPRGSTAGGMGEERVARGRQAAYTVGYVDTNGDHGSENIKEEVWNQIEVGQVVAARYRQHNGKLASVTWDSARVSTS